MIATGLRARTTLGVLVRAHANKKRKFPGFFFFYIHDTASHARSNAIIIKQLAVPIKGAERNDLASMPGRSAGICQAACRRACQMMRFGDF